LDAQGEDEEEEEEVASVGGWCGGLASRARVVYSVEKEKKREKKGRRDG
jgi:hypothetical protein